MKETITIYKLIDQRGYTTTSTIELIGYKTLASVEVEVEFPRIDEQEGQRLAIKKAIDDAKAMHKEQLEKLEKELTEL